jgi:hypothetical protein
MTRRNTALAKIAVKIKAQAALVPAQVPFQISAKPLRFQKCAGCAGVPA